ncbi:MAG: FtsX-like permease family protein [Planctomycetes bacterium]|nr:FtsX-like permease family protein [Planctomycetota bacterium]
MKIFRIVFRNLLYYRRNNATLALATAVCVGIICGALLIGSSVRASLKDLALKRLGPVDKVLSTGITLDPAIASKMSDNNRGTYISLVMLNGSARKPNSGLSSNKINLIGLPDLGAEEYGGYFEACVNLAGRNAVINQVLADDIGANPGDEIIMKIPSIMVAPAESLFGRRRVGENITSLRLKVASIIPMDKAGRFSLDSGSAPPRNIYVAMDWISESLGKRKANTIFDTGRDGKADEAFRRCAVLSDFGCRFVDRSASGYISLESENFVFSGMQSGVIEKAMRELVVNNIRTSVYLANSLSLSKDGSTRSVPYSTIAGLDITPSIGPSLPVEDNVIVLNKWTADQLGAETGDSISLAYYETMQDGTVHEKTKTFILSGVVGMSGTGVDAGIVPDYPGLTDAESIDAWKPPFEMDLAKIRKIDEEYWDKYRAAPKAFISFPAAAAMWGGDGGRSLSGVTSFRIPVAKGSDVAVLIKSLDHELGKRYAASEAAPVFRNVRADALRGSTGSTDFGELFLYMSFFLIVSALILVAMIFRLSIEKRSQEIGLLMALGFSPRRINVIFMIEAILAALAGSIGGILLGPVYADYVLAGLRSSWSGAVAGFPLFLHLRTQDLVVGGASGFLAALFAVWLSTRGIFSLIVKDLLAGWKPGFSQVSDHKLSLYKKAAILLLVIPLILVGCGVAGVIPPVAAFISAGSMLLIFVMILFICIVSRKRVGEYGLSVATLVAKFISRSRGRSFAVFSLMAAASFIIVAVAANVRGTASYMDYSRSSGSGGFRLLVETSIPFYADLSTRHGWIELGLEEKEIASEIPKDAIFVPLKRSGGEEASCLNLNHPQSPSVVGVGDEFARSNRFTFTNAADWTAIEKDNLAVADASSAQWILKKGIGDFQAVYGRGDVKDELKLQGLISGSIFQGDLVTSTSTFNNIFGADTGYSAVLVECDAADSKRVRDLLGKHLSDYGVQIRDTSELLAGFAEVQNTYLSAFALLGGMGMALGTLGVAGILLRNMVDRKREFAVLCAIGFGRSLIVRMVLIENMALVISGILSGAACSLLAMIPQITSEGAAMDWGSVLLYLSFSAAIAFISCWIAARISISSNLIRDLRAE